MEGGKENDWTTCIVDRKMEEKKSPDCRSGKKRGGGREELGVTEEREGAISTNGSADS